MSRPFAPRNLGREAWRHRVRRPDGVVALASGGLDSSALLAEMARRGHEVFPIFVKAGLVWERAELAGLRRFLAALPESIGSRVRPLKVASALLDGLYGEHWSTTGRGIPGWRAADNSVYLPGRNAVLLTQAAVYAALVGAPRVALGVLAGNPFPDATPRFFRALQEALSEGLDYPIELQAPFRRLYKEEVIRRSADLPLHLTVSCSQPAGGGPCGRCAKCRERTLALRAAGFARSRTPRTFKEASSR